VLLAEMKESLKVGSKERNMAVEMAEGRAEQTAIVMVDI
jgi:hypothetical protein